LDPTGCDLPATCRLVADFSRTTCEHLGEHFGRLDLRAYVTMGISIPTNQSFAGMHEWRLDLAKRNPERRLIFFTATERAGALFAEVSTDALGRLEGLEDFTRPNCRRLGHSGSAALA
jgi:hypothetical protein